jgi:molybdate transport system regulatory protein
MNKLSVKISEIQCAGGVILVDLLAGETQMSALLIDAIEKPDWLKKGNTLFVVFKEAEVTLAKGFSGKISTRNKLPCKVQYIEKGQLISLVTLDFYGNIIRSAVTSRAVEHLDLQLDDNVTALIKSTELTLMQKI